MTATTYIVRTPKSDRTRITIPDAADVVAPATGVFADAALAQSGTSTVPTVFDSSYNISPAAVMAISAGAASVTLAGMYLATIRVAWVFVGGSGIFVRTITLTNNTTAFTGDQASDTTWINTETTSRPSTVDCVTCLVALAAGATLSVNLTSSDAATAFDARVTLSLTRVSDAA
jgi:hypothetical protein